MLKHVVHIGRASKRSREARATSISEAYNYKKLRFMEQKRRRKVMHNFFFYLTDAH
jgi:hypothetical protein